MDSGLVPISPNRADMGDLAQLSEDMKLHIAQLKAQINSGDSDLKTEIEDQTEPPSSSNLLPPPPQTSLMDAGDAPEDPPKDPPADAGEEEQDPKPPEPEAHSSTKINPVPKKRKKVKRSSLHSQSSSTPPRSITEGTEEAIPVKYLQMSSKSPRSKQTNNKQILNKKPDGVCSSDIDSAAISANQPTPRSIDSKTPRTDRQLKYEERIIDLKKKNTELVAIARRLEEKAKSLQEQNVKKSQDLRSVTQDLQQQKRSHQRHRVRCETEHSRTLNECETQLRTAQAQLADLKLAMKQTRREKLVKNAGNDSGDENIMVQKQLEMMKLQKLAAAASNKVVIRSLSTPVTARQKILETSNRNLRRQIASLEAELQNFQQKSEDHLGNEELKEENRALQEQISALESQLGESKIETSDISVQYQELKHLHEQLQWEYNTVHGQLAVAIQERDKAVQQCREFSSTITDMETTIKNFDKTRESFKSLQSQHMEAQQHHLVEVGNLKSEHDSVVADYQQTLQHLQSKVNELEAQCREQDMNNKNMKQQISELIQWSREKDSHSPVVNRAENRNNNNMIQHPVHRRTPSQDSRASDSVASHHSHQDLAQGKLRMVPQVTTTDDTEIEDFYEDEILPQSGDKVHRSEMIASGSLKVFIAKYTYNPQEGPNEHPEAELPLVAGDYVYVCGEIDEDGFFEGELMSGQRGLVPSNFLEPVPDDRLLPHCDARMLSSGHSNDKHRSVESELSHSYCSSVTTNSCDLESSDVTDCHSINSSVLPYPRKLRVDKKLSHSLIIGWVVPKLDNDEIVEDYHILVDGRLATVVSGNKSKAVVENIYYNKQKYCISVCAVTGHRRSNPMHCFLYYGHGSAHNKINNVRVDYLGTSSARLSWSPSRSNVQHVISIGQVTSSVTRLSQYQRQIIVAPPLYEHTIHGLKIGAMYEVVVNMKTNKQSDEAAGSDPIRFTTNTVEPPSAPSSVKISLKSESIIEVSWTSDDFDDISIYFVFMNGIKIAESANDYCEISMKSVFGILPQIGYDVNRMRSPSYTPFIEITLQGKSSSGVFSDVSEPTIFPESFIEKLLQLPLVTETSPKTRRKTKRELFDESPHPVVPSIEITHDTSSDDENNHRRRFREKEAAKKSSQNREIPSDPRSATIDPSFFSRESPAVGRLARRRVHSDDDSCSSSSTSSLNRRQPVEGWEKRPTFQVGGRTVKSHQPKNEDKFSDKDSASNLSPVSRHTRSVQDKRLVQSSTLSSQSGPDSVTELDISDSRVSLYVALYDYNPYTMSPNQDCLQDELSFTEGQLIKVYGEKDGDGFYMGEKHNGKRGYVPCNMVSEVQVDDYTMLEELFDRGHLPSVSSDHRTSSHNDQLSDHNGSADLITQDGAPELSSELLSVAPTNSDVKLYVALFDYDPKESSPNIDAEAELSFARGDLIHVHGVMDEDGFFRGERNGCFGLVPSNFLEEVTENTGSNHLKPEMNGYSAPVPTISAETMTEATVVNNPIKVEPTSVTSTSSTTSSIKSDGSKRKGIFSKGKQLLKKFGDKNKR
ncbi:RIMS-binding protein 2 isoform X1 [Ciona intestinalis]